MKPTRSYQTVRNCLQSMEDNIKRPLVAYSSECWHLMRFSSDAGRFCAYTASRNRTDSKNGSKMFKWRTFFSFPDEDVSDRIAHLLTFVLLVGAAVVAYHRTASGRILQCYSPSGLDSFVQVPHLSHVELLCSQRPMYSYRGQEPKVARRLMFGFTFLQGLSFQDLRSVSKIEPDYSIHWVPYVPYVLAFAAILALSPNLVRLLCCPCSGLDFGAYPTTSREELDRFCSLIADQILKKKLPVRYRFQYALSKKERCRRFSSGPLFYHFLTKLYTMAVLVCVWHIVKTIFPLAESYGIFDGVQSILAMTVSGKAPGIQNGSFVFHKLFPMDFLCFIEYRGQGAIKTSILDYHCVFTMNSVFGSLFFILIVWLILGLACQAVSILCWFLALFVIQMKKGFVETALENSATDALLDHRFLDLIMTPDTMLALHKLRAYAGQHATDEVVKILYVGYRREEEKKSGGRDHQEVMV